MKTLQTNYGGTLKASDLNNDNKAVMRGFLGLGKGVVSGLELTQGTGLTVHVAPGAFSAQVADVVTDPFDVTAVAGDTRYLWIEANDTQGDAPNWTFEPEGSDPGSTYVCLGSVTANATAVTAIGTDGRKAYGHKIVEALPVGDNLSVPLQELSLKVVGADASEEADLFIKYDPDGRPSLYIRRQDGTEEPFYSRFKLHIHDYSPPPQDMGRTNDIYLDYLLGKWYQRINGAWNLVATIPVPTKGDRGSMFLGAFDTVTSFPQTNGITVRQGDFAFADSTGKLYVANQSSWTIVGKIRGEDGVGTQGNPGVTPSITIGTVSTLAQGTPGTATLTGTATNPVLNLGLPKGDQGTAGVVTYNAAGAISAAKRWIGSATTAADGSFSVTVQTGVFTAAPVNGVQLTPVGSTMIVPVLESVTRNATTGTVTITGKLFKPNPATITLTSPILSVAVGSGVSVNILAEGV